MKCCERCGESLVGKRSVALELNSHTGLYGEPGSVPAAESQGVFWFGAACAKRITTNDGRNKQIKGRA